MTRLPKISRAVEFLDFPLRGGEIKEFDDKLGRIGGYANYKNNLDYTDDITRDGAFRKTIQDAYSRKNAQGLDFLYPYLWSHDFSTVPPGGVYDADEDKKGFYTRTQFNLDLQSGRDLYSSFKMGTLKKQSIGYKAIQSNFEKDPSTGRTFRNLLEIQVMEISAVVFPANDMAQVDMIKSREDYNMLLRNKDFTSNYASQQLDDWQFDDWSGIAAALQASIMDLFAPGADPLAAFDREVLPGLLDALRQYISDGMSLGYSTGPASAAGVSPMMMSMSGYGASESKSGYLNASDHTAIKESSAMIMKHAKIIASASARVENANARARANALQGYPVYSGASDRSYFEEKQDESDEMERLGLLAASLKTQNSLRELKALREANTPENPLVAGVDAALARFLSATERK